MFRLLRANFARLWKTKSFWVCVIIAVFDSFTRFVFNCVEDGSCTKRLGDLLTGGGTDIMLVAAVFTALYLGTDYSNGTIRNKLIIGRKRAEVYFANLITVMAGTFIITAVDRAVTLFCGLARGGALGQEEGDFAFRQLVVVCALTAFCAVNTLIGMLVSSKASVVTATLCALFASMFISAPLLAFLGMPEYFDSSMVGTAAQTEGAVRFEITTSPEFAAEGEKNPLYVDGARRVMFSVVNDMLPAGAVSRLENGAAAEECRALPLYSLGLTAAATAVGALIFRKKDIK
ncbi:MAG: ABC transporter permease [Lachnospiraceae bacterium]|nr:ABC transporter permease [Ruminococcus sp.]MCM1273965.1 ABC transporter permease [Lachnospiraceae bacterium]